MLVLVAGVTGNLGSRMIDSFISRGHQVRGLGRNPSKLPSELRQKLENFVEVSSSVDVTGLEKACHGVDAVVCAYQGHPELVVEGQLLLLRAAERMGVKRFVANSWNCDWRDMTLGMQESYDPMLTFQQLVKLTSTIRPVYIFTGVLAEVLFSVPGHGAFTPANKGVWDPKDKRMEYYGNGEDIWYWTSERDAAEFTAEIVQLEEYKQGGYWNIYSGAHSLLDIARTYEKVKGRKVTVQCKGSIEDLRREALEARSKATKPLEYFEYCGLFYQLYTNDGTYRHPCVISKRLHVETISLEQFLSQNPSV
ncbi:hypothetical protein AFLA_011370 [Aspergillus flavus NRRL3357]|nr:uncharacterized protein G4B84_007391 [Aspergillus flavus NRRL3357]KAF7621054.1 hypothetical protein AFLA_011370 [Aspergillus flavus NRRL3357]KAJ1704899.1 NAD dependent epimerase/dehydratase [Aspergillus flavus]QMW32010.1 hypothetical protein G4B84_007391 [Aspergillus flavus NRRL3357]